MLHLELRDSSQDELQSDPKKEILTPNSSSLEHSDTWYKDQVLDNYSHGVAHTSAEVEDNERDHRKWMNPLETRLPLAPNLKIFCFYGVGKSTERSYFYREDQDPNSSLNVTMDTSLMMGAVDHGVIPGEGDGTGTCTRSPSCLFWHIF